MEWFDNLPAELKEAPFLRATDDGPRDLNQVVSDLNDAAQHMGNSIRIPGNDAGDEAMAAFRQRATEKIPGLMVIPSQDDAEAMTSVFRSMGMPEEAGGYKLPQIEGLEISDEDATALRTAAHNLQLTQRQFEAMVQTQHEQGVTARDSQQAAFQEGIDSLKSEWGAAYDNRVADVKALMTKIDAPEYVVNMLNNGTLPAGDLKMFYAMADMVGAEGNELSTQPNQSVVPLTPDQAQAELSEIENRADKALWDPMHTDHQRLVRRRNELMELAYPESSRDDLRTSYGS